MHYFELNAEVLILIFSLGGTNSQMFFQKLNKLSQNFDFLF